ncbi:9831_t:CDS:2 [Entrophospora sp. SA101]|nr:9831_t:CDS:2 [Entrophospora sp. SA101]
MPQDQTTDAWIDSNILQNFADMPTIRTEWTSEDDSLLKIGVKNFGYENWEKIASTIPGRNEYQCKKRFDYILSSSHFINDHDDVVNRFNVKNILAEHHPTFFNADLGGLTDKMSQSQLDHDDSTTSSTERQQQHLNISLDCDDVVNRFNVKNILAEHHPTFFNADLGGLTDKMSQSQLDHDDSTTSSTERQQQHLNISLDWNKTVDTALLHSVAIQAQNVEKELLPFPTISTHTNPSLPNSPNIFNSSDRPYKCSTCELAFARNHDLKRHQKIHEKVKPYKCDGCSKHFSRLDALRRHRQNPKSRNACQMTLFMENSIDSNIIK